MEKQGTLKSVDRTNLLILSALPILLIIIGFLLDTPKEIFGGLYKIIIGPDILLVDYLAVGGIGATFLNVGLLTLICIYIVHIYKIPLTGPLIAAVLTITGFAFMGKNIINVLPIFLGGFLYSKYKKVEIKSIIVAVFFVTTLAPAVTHVALGLGLDYIISIPLSLVTGILIGFVVAPLAAQFVKFHDGYNLYNIGFTGGILGTLIGSLIRGFGFTVEPQSVLSVEYSDFLRNLLIIICIGYIILGYIMNKKSFKGYSRIFKFSGRLLTNFIDQFGFGLAYVNMGITGLISILYVILLKGTFNGPVVAGIITIIAFSPFGKNPKNIIPILIGVYIAGTVTVFDVSSTSIIIAALFGTTLAPIAGAYGPIAGIFAGFLHVFIVTNVIKIHGGLNLYNNGFAGGIVAAIMVPILGTFFKKKEGIE